MRLKTIHCETTALLGYYAVGDEFSVAWCQPIGLMKMDGRKYSRPVTEGKNSKRCDIAKNRKTST
jgi:hypothetical protein